MSSEHGPEKGLDQTASESIEAADAEDQITEKQTEEEDPNVVWWDGPDDPEVGESLLHSYVNRSRARL